MEQGGPQPPSGRSTFTWQSPGSAKGAGPAGTVTCLSLSFQVVDLLNQAALITNDSKITVLKQVREGAVLSKRARGRGMGACEKEDTGSLARVPF